MTTEPKPTSTRLAHMVRDLLNTWLTILIILAGFTAATVLPPLPPPWRWLLIVVGIGWGVTAFVQARREDRRSEESLERFKQTLAEIDARYHEAGDHRVSRPGTEKVRYS